MPRFAIVLASVLVMAGGAAATAQVKPSALRAVPAETTAAKATDAPSCTTEPRRETYA